MCGAAKLGELERRLMDVVWADPNREWTGREVATALSDYAYTTVATMLDRLVRKGLLRRRMQNHVIRFTVIGTESAHAAIIMREALEATRDPMGTLACFTEVISPAEAE